MGTQVHGKKPKLYLPYFQIQRALEIKNLPNGLLFQGYIPEWNEERPVTIYSSSYISMWADEES